MSGVHFFLMLVSLATLGITLFVYRGKREATYQSFLLLGAGFSFWTISIALMQAFRSSIFIVPILFSGFLAFGGFYLLTRTFPDLKKNVSWDLYLFLVPLALLAVALPFDLIIEDAVFHADGTVEPVNGPLFPFFVLIAFAYLIAGVDLIFRKWKRAVGRERLQIAYLALGLCASFALIVPADILLPLLGVYQFNILGSAAPLLFVGCTAYAIVRHQLLDIQIIIQRGLIFTTILVGIVGVYIATLTTLGIVFGHMTNLTVAVSAGITSLVGIFSVPRIDAALRKITDGFFFKDKYNYSQSLHALSGRIGRNMQPEDIVRITESALRDLFKTGTVSMRILHTEEATAIRGARVAPNRTTLVVPILLDGAPIGSIRLGEKLSGDIYTEEDIMLLETFSHHIAIACEKARLFQEVEEYSRELEQRVSARTAEIQTLQEDQKQLMLDISHKLQNPLTIVKGELAALQKHIPQKTEFAAFETTINDISAFVYDLLHLAQLDAQKETDERERIDLSTLIRDEFIEYFETIAHSEKISLTHEIERDVHITGNSEKLTELLTNLVSNAVKYMGDVSGTRERRICIILNRAGDDSVLLTVADTGMGIEPDDLPRIFDRFYRGVNNRHATIAGTGLGLAICKKIAESHGGTISVRSALRKGTTFTVSLPHGSYTPPSEITSPNSSQETLPAV